MIYTANWIELRQKKFSTGSTYRKAMFNKSQSYD